MEYLTIKPTKLTGTIFVPPSKSMAHRAIICAFLSEGTSEIRNVELSNDIIATCRAVEALGANIDITDCKISSGRKNLIIIGNGTVKVKNNRINCLESGTTARFIIPVSRLTSDKITIDGENRLVERPFDLFLDIFGRQDISCETNNKKLPITLEGELKPGLFEIRGDVSSQFISGLMLALPLLSGDSVIKITTPVQSSGYIDMTLKIQKLFGISINYNREENKLLIPGWQKYSPCSYEVEGDWSQAAFWLAAGALSGPVEVGGLNSDSIQGDRVIGRIMQKMGIELEWKDGFISVKQTRPKGMDIDVSQCPDLAPVLAVLCAVSEGRSRILNAARLRLKECDRLNAISVELKALGALITENDDSLIIDGVNNLKGGRIFGWNDHRIVMAAAIASSVCAQKVIIEGSEAVNKSYPAFWDHFKSLGGEVF
jgi:3-phosphoshikimate 1-carboxyvinyltransferase